MSLARSRQLHQRFTESAPCDPWPESIPPPLIFERGKGSHVWDADGNRYIDFVLGMGPLVLGHSPVPVLDAVSAQIHDGILFATPTELEIKLAERIRVQVPCAERVRFGTSGSEAVHAALRLARASTGRSKILRFEGHYHGWLDNIAWEGTKHGKTPYAKKGQIASDCEGLLILPWNDLPQVEEIFDKRGSEIAGVILEPVMASCGMICPLEGYLAGLRKLCSDNGAVLIFDEVVTGFRLAQGGAQEYFGVVPDLAVFGKALGAGFPISSVAGKEWVMRAWKDAAPILAGTHAANPVSLRAALAALDILAEGSGHAIKLLRESADRLRLGLESLKDQTSSNLVVRGVGPLLHVSFVPGDARLVTDYRTYLQTDFRATARLFDHLRTHGVHVGHDGRWFVSTAHSEEDIEATIQALGLSLEEMEHSSILDVGAPRSVSVEAEHNGREKNRVDRLTSLVVCRHLYRKYRSERDQVWKHLEEHHPKNLHWIVGWEVSHKCNLSCVYCEQDHQSGHPNENFQKGLEQILRIQPRLVWITGGEPSKVPGLPDVLQRIKRECGDPSLVMSTNFQRPTAIFEEFAGILDFMFITLDGLAEDNWANRGFNGRKLLDRLVEFIPRHPRVEFTLTTVATVHNIETLESFGETIQAELPGINQYIWPMNPTFHPLSIGSTPELARKFAGIMERLMKRYPSVRGSTPKNKEADSTHGGNSSFLRRWLSDADLVHCDRQYFYADIGANGLLMDCRMARIIPNLDYRANCALERGESLEMLRVLQLLRKQTRELDDYHPICSYPCTCVEGIGEILLAKSKDDPALHAVPQLLGRRFRPEDRHEAASYIRRHINPDFEESFFDVVGPRSGETS